MVLVKRERDGLEDPSQEGGLETYESAGKPISVLGSQLALRNPKSAIGTPPSQIPSCRIAFSALY